MTQRLLPKDAGETIVVAFDFLADLEAGESINGAAVAATVAQGADAAPAALLSGQPAVLGADVQQMVAAGVTGATYRLRCTATLSSGRVLVLAALLPIREA